MMLRVTGVIVAIGTSCALTVGCGATRTTPAGNASSAGAGGSIDRAHATAYAHAVNLTAADVPEMASAGKEEETKVRSLGVENAHCSGGVSPYRRVVDVHSVRFKGATASPRESVTSDVTVWPTNALAEHNSAAGLSQRGRACAQHLLERLAIDQIGRVRVSRISIAWLPPPLPGAKDSYAARISLTITGELGPSHTPSERSSAALESSSPNPPRVQIPLYVDGFGFLAGRAEVTLTATGVQRPASSAIEHRLLSVLYSRAKAHIL
jgi:hypothetical protein